MGKYEASGGGIWNASLLVFTYRKWGAWKEGGDRDVSKLLLNELRPYFPYYVAAKTNPTVLKKLNTKVFYVKESKN